MIQVSRFHFYTERRLVALTGLRARTLPELLAILQEVPGSSIFYHTHHLFLSHHFEKPVVYNEFAIWISEALQEEALAERISAIDLRAFTSIRQLRNVLISLIQSHLETTGGRSRDCPPGDEFHFCRSKSFILPTGIIANDVRDFFLKLSEALWKNPVIGGAVGGIKIQVINGITGFLVHSPEGAAQRALQLLSNPQLCQRMGENGYQHVKQNFRLTRHAKDYMLLMLALDSPGEDIVHLG